MAKLLRTDLLEAGLEVLGSRGAKALTTRAIEDEAGATHGTIRHHFGSYSGFLSALVDHLLAIDLPHADESLHATIARWLGPQRVQTMARYELALIAAHDGALAARFTEARFRLASMASGATGLSFADSHLLLTSLDGLILDALLRGAHDVDPGPTLVRFGIRQGPSS